MNIIQLFETLSLDKSKIGTFSKEEIISIESKLYSEKEKNQAISEVSINNLMNALKYHSDSFRAIFENRVLYNFFTNKEKSRDYFHPELVSQNTEKIKSFVGLFLGNDIKSLFNKSFEENQYYKASVVAEAFSLFPDNIAYYIHFEAKHKLDLANKSLIPPYSDLSKVEFLKEGSFYSFLDKIKTPDLEDKLNNVFDLIIGVFRENFYSELAGKAFSGISNYHAMDSSFAEKIRSYHEKGLQYYKPYAPKKKNLTWVFVVVGLFVLLRVGFFIANWNINNRNFGNDSDNYYDDDYVEEAATLDPYYTEMKFKIDSFHTFLADFNPKDVKNFTINSGLKSGENPFDTFYKNVEKSESSNYINIKNNSDYDMVLLESNVVYDSIKIPVTAYYLKAHDKATLNSVATNAVFNIYIGKNLASFKTNEGNLFITQKSTVEYRFKDVAPHAKELLQTDFYFDNEVDVDFKNGNLDVNTRIRMN